MDSAGYAGKDSGLVEETAQPVHPTRNDDPQSNRYLHLRVIRNTNAAIT